MVTATKYYRPLFKTGLPFAKLYTYDSDTGILSNVYSNVEGDKHTNPVIMNERGESIIYIDSSIIYRYVLKDKDDNLICDIDNIKQSRGKDGDPNSVVVGPQGPDGLTGVQGESVVGPDGPDGFQGNQGLPLLTKSVLLNNQVVTIPAGVSEIFITAAGGGGSAASWSPYCLFMPVKRPDGSVYGLNMSAKYDNGSFNNSTNQLTFENLGLLAISLTPGSGFAGQSTYRYKFTFSDTTVSHTVTAFIGSGGSQNTAGANNNGIKGSSTKIYVDGKNILELAGGLAGENKMPLNDTEAANLITNSNGSFYYNMGYKNSMFYFQISGNGNGWQPSSTGGDYQADYAYSTKYLQKSGSIFVENNVQVGYRAMYYDFNNTIFYSYVYDRIDNLKGDKTIFDTFYSRYQTQRNDYVELAGQAFRNSIKDVSYEGLGAGGGGDVFYGYITSKDSSNHYITQIYSDYILSSNKIVFYMKDYLKDRFIDFLSKFTVADSYSPGTINTPSKTDTSGVWAVADNTKLRLQSNYNYVIDGPYFLNFGNMSIMNYPEIRYGGKGADGYAYVEYGGITEITS